MCDNGDSEHDDERTQRLAATAIDQKIEADLDSNAVGYERLLIEPALSVQGRADDANDDDSGDSSSTSDESDRRRVSIDQGARGSLIAYPHERPDKRLRDLIALAKAQGGEATEVWGA